MSIANNLAEVHSEIHAACARAQRPTTSVQLLVVSKTFSVQEIAEAGQHTLPIFGESRVQEALVKIPQLPSNFRWHFIGHLQSNKIRKILPYLTAVHSVDSLSMAQDLNRIALELKLRPQVYLQVNVARDGAKFGFSPEDVTSHLESLLNLAALEIVGLMTIPFAVENPADARPHFASLRKLRDELETRAARSLPGLSMGMSDDFQVAIEEGATIVRVGSRIFGQR
jgi:pyridoxal phosphate enzyme (YggS family)